MDKWGVYLLSSFIIFALGVPRNTYCHTDVRTFTLEELCQESELIVLGKIIEIESNWIEGKKQIKTEIIIEVKTVYKGNTNSGETIAISKLGGTVNGITMMAVGEPQYQIGTESILFLFEDRNPTSTVNGLKLMGFAQGKFNCFSLNGDKLVRREQFNNALETIAGKKTFLFPNDTHIYFSEFENQILQHLMRKGS